jgi:hypothetical protein
MRAQALEAEDSAILDRGVAGIRGRTLLLNLPAGLTLSMLFLGAVVDLLPLILAKLQSPAARGSSPTTDEVAPGQDEGDSAQVAAHKLDPDEFAAFVRNRRREET